MKISDHPYYTGMFLDVSVVLNNDAKSLSSFICTNGVKNDLRIYTPDGKEVLDTFGIFVNKCCDQEFMLELRKALATMQKKAKK